MRNIGSTGQGEWPDTTALQNGCVGKPNISESKSGPPANPPNAVRGQWSVYALVCAVKYCSLNALVRVRVVCNSNTLATVSNLVQELVDSVSSWTATLQIKDGCFNLAKAISVAAE